MAWPCAICSLVEYICSRKLTRPRLQALAYADDNRRTDRKISQCGAGERLCVICFAALIPLGVLCQCRQRSSVKQRSMHRYVPQVKAEYEWHTDVCVPCLEAENERRDED